MTDREPAPVSYNLTVFKQVRVRVCINGMLVSVNTANSLPIGPETDASSQGASVQVWCGGDQSEVFYGERSVPHIRIVSKITVLPFTQVSSN